MSHRIWCVVVTGALHAKCQHVLYLLLFSKINSTLYVVIKMKRSLWFFPFQNTTIIEWSICKPECRTLGILGIGPWDLQIYEFQKIHFPQLFLVTLYRIGNAIKVSLDNVFSQIEVLSHKNKAENYERDWKLIHLIYFILLCSLNFKNFWIIRLNF